MLGGGASLTALTRPGVFAFRHNPQMLTPRSDELVAEGIMMERSYVFMYCAPTRSAIMSGRLPYHVNQVILGMNNP